MSKRERVWLQGMLLLLLVVEERVKELGKVGLHFIGEQEGGRA